MPTCAAQLSQSVPVPNLLQHAGTVTECLVHGFKASCQVAIESLKQLEAVVTYMCFVSCVTIALQTI